MNLPAATFVEFKAIEFARKAVAVFQAIDFDGADIHPFDEGAAAVFRPAAIRMLKTLAMVNAQMMMEVESMANSGHPWAHDAICDLIQDHNDHGEGRLPSHLAVYNNRMIEAVRAGKVFPEPKRGPKSESNFLRDAIIAVVVAYVARESGLKVTRSPASAGPCACSIVADVLQLSYETVKRIWQKYGAPN